MDFVTAFNSMFSQTGGIQELALLTLSVMVVIGLIVVIRGAVYTAVLVYLLLKALWLSYDMQRAHIRQFRAGGFDLSRTAFATALLKSWLRDAFSLLLGNTVCRRDGSCEWSLNEGRRDLRS